MISCCSPNHLLKPQGVGPPQAASLETVDEEVKISGYLDVEEFGMNYTTMSYGPVSAS
jgi:hypothetical protein